MLFSLGLICTAFVMPEKDNDDGICAQQDVDTEDFEERYNEDFHGEHGNHNSFDTVNMPIYKKNRVIIYSRKHTRYSFFQTFFTADPGFFTVFEPLAFIDPDADYPSLSRWYLDDVFECQFKNMMDIGKVKWNISQYGECTNINECPFLRVKNDMFCKGRNIGDIIEEKCRLKSAEELEELCKERKVILTTVTRISQVHFFYPFLRKGVYVLQLITDPRALIATQLQMESSEQDHNLERVSQMIRISDTAKNYCNNLMKDVMFLRNLQKSHDKGALNHYKLIRYEDLAKDVLDTMGHIYTLMHLPFQIKHYYWNKPFEMEDGKLLEGVLENKYFWDISQMWRKQMMLDMIIVIQSSEVCSEMMETFGYRKVYTEKQLLDMDTPLVDDLPFDVNNYY